VTSNNKITEIVNLLLETYNRKDFSQNLYDAWKIAVRDISPKMLDYGVERILQERDSNFFPNPAEFRKYCTTREGMSVKDEAAIEWAFFLKVLNDFHFSHIQVWRNKVTAETVRLMFGDCFQAGLSLPDETSENAVKNSAYAFRKKEFIDMYCSIRTLIFKNPDQYSSVIEPRTRFKISYSKWVYLTLPNQPEFSTDEKLQIKNTYLTEKKQLTSNFKKLFLAGLNMKRIEGPKKTEVKKEKWVGNFMQSAGLR